MYNSFRTGQRGELDLQTLANVVIDVERPVILAVMG